MITGLGLAADTIELFVVAYVIPSAEVELCMSGTDKGWLGEWSFGSAGVVLSLAGEFSVLFMY